MKLTVEKRYATCLCCDEDKVFWIGTNRGEVYTLKDELKCHLDTQVDSPIVSIAVKNNNLAYIQDDVLIANGRTYTEGVYRRLEVNNRNKSLVQCEGFARIYNGFFEEPILKVPGNYATLDWYTVIASNEESNCIYTFDMEGKLLNVFKGLNEKPFTKISCNRFLSNGNLYSEDKLISTNVIDFSSNGMATLSVKTDGTITDKKDKKTGMLSFKLTAICMGHFKTLIGDEEGQLILYDYETMQQKYMLPRYIQQ